MTPTAPPRQFVCIKPDTQNETLIVRYPHPRTGVSSIFALDNVEDGYRLLECQRIGEAEEEVDDGCNIVGGSWLVKGTSEQVWSDGSLYVFTPYDPLWLLVSKLSDPNCAGRFLPLDDIFEDDENSMEASCRLLLSCTGADRRIEQVCEVTTIGDPISVLKTYRFSEERLFALVQSRARRIVEEFDEYSVLSRLIAPQLREDTSPEIIQALKLRAAISLLSSNLSSALSDKLLAAHDFFTLEAYEKSLHQADIADSMTPQDYARLKNGKKLDPFEEDMVTSTKKVKVVKTPGQLKLEKADKRGMKSMTSFFAKKA